MAALYRQILFPLPTCYILYSILSSWMIHATKTKYTDTSRVPGLTEHLLPTFVGILGDAFAVLCLCMGLVGEGMKPEHGAHTAAVGIALAISEHSG